MTRARETADVVESKNQCTAWGNFQASGGPPDEGFNMGNSTNNSTGNYSVVFDEPLDTITYAVIVTAQTNTGGYNVTYSNKLTTGFDYHVRNVAGSVATDVRVSIAVFGGKN